MNCKVCEGHGEWSCMECGNGHFHTDMILFGTDTSCDVCANMGFIVCHACNGNGYMEMNEPLKLIKKENGQ